MILKTIINAIKKLFYSLKWLYRICCVQSSNKVSEKVEKTPKAPKNKKKKRRKGLRPPRDPSAHRDGQRRKPDDSISNYQEKSLDEIDLSREKQTYEAARPKRSKRKRNQKKGIIQKD